MNTMRNNSIPIFSKAGNDMTRANSSFLMPFAAWSKEIFKRNSKRNIYQRLDVGKINRLYLQQIL